MVVIENRYFERLFFKANIFTSAFNLHVNIIFFSTHFNKRNHNNNFYENVRQEKMDFFYYLFI